MHSPTGGNQFLIAQNGPIKDHTAEADAFTSALREIVAAEAGAMPSPTSEAAPSAAKHVSRTVRSLGDFLMAGPYHLEI
jgi:hypothetical protein